MHKDAIVLREIIRNRRSIFPADYLDKEIPMENIQEILESANFAPTHKLTQPWRFTVFLAEGKTKLGKEMARIYTEQTPAEKFLQKKHDSLLLKTSQANCIIAVNAQLHPDKVPEWEEIASIGCAVQNMALTAAALDIGAYWSSPAVIKQLGTFLGFNSPDQKCFGLFYLGYHNATNRNAIRTPMADKVQWVVK